MRCVSPVSIGNVDLSTDPEVLVRGYSLSLCLSIRMARSGCSLTSAIQAAFVNCVCDILEKPIPSQCLIERAPSNSLAHRKISASRRTPVSSPQIANMNLLCKRFDVS